MYLTHTDEHLNQLIILALCLQSAEAYPGRKTDDTPMASLSSFSKRYGSLEQAISTGLVEEIMDTPPPPAVAVSALPLNRELSAESHGL